MSEPETQPPAPTTQLPGAFELIKPSFAALWLNILALLAFMLIPIMGSIIALSFTAAQAQVGGDPSNGSVIVFALIILLFALLAGPLFTYIQIQSVRAKKVSISETVKHAVPAIVDYFFAGLVVGIIVVLGLLLFIVPGIFMIKRYYLTMYFIVDKRLGIFASMKASHELAKQNPGAIWGLIGVTFLFSIIQIVPLIGQLIGGILGLIYSYAPAIRYEQLTTGNTTPIEATS